MAKKMNIRGLIRIAQEEAYEEMRFEFKALGKGKQYTKKQRDYAIKQIDKYGIRATARILRIPRRTLQRWCKKHHIVVARCPSWVYAWAAKRRRRRQFWGLSGYGSTTYGGRESIIYI